MWQYEYEVLSFVYYPIVICVVTSDVTSPRITYFMVFSILVYLITWLVHFLANIAGSKQRRDISNTQFSWTWTDEPLQCAIAVTSFPLLILCIDVAEQALVKKGLREWWNGITFYFFFGKSTDFLFSFRVLNILDRLDGCYTDKILVWYTNLVL